MDKYLYDNELSTLPPGVIGHSINWEEQYVESFFLNKWISDVLKMPTATAVYLSPSLGCQMHSEPFKPSHLQNRGASALPVFLQPTAHIEFRSECVENVIRADFTPEGLSQNQSRAVVVMHNGRLVAEGYQSLMSISVDTPLLGWSMTKSAHAAIVGAAVQAGIIHLDEPLQLPDMEPTRREKLAAMNGGKPITFRTLLHMNDILEIEENYGILADIAHMLYGTPDTAAYASICTTKPIAPPAASEINDSSFGWYYSSGVSNTLAKELRLRFPSDVAYRDFPHTHLFRPIGATSFALEMDTSGTFIASSFGYATARDWAKLGELFLNHGRFGGKQVIPEDFVALVQQPHPRSGGHYGGQFWLNPARVSVAEYNLLPHNHKDKRRRQWLTHVLPADAYYMNGYLGQTTMIIPSANAVIVRLGFTREQALEEVPVWDPKKFYGGILKCLQQEQ